MLVTTKNLVVENEKNINTPESENKIVDNPFKNSKLHGSEVVEEATGIADNNLNAVVAENADAIFYEKRCAVNETLVTEKVVVDASAFKPGAYEMMDDDKLIAGAVSEISLVRKQAKPFRFSVMPFYSPHISFHRIENDDHDGRRWQEHERDEIRHGEQHQNNNTFGLQIAMPISKHWGIQSGVSYTMKKIDIEPKKVFAKLDDDGKVKYRFDCSSGYTYLASKTGVR